MTAASSNRSKTSYVVESTKGTTPTSPAFTTMRVTSNGLALDPKRIQSNEIRSDRQVPDNILVDLDTAGPLGIELSFAAHDWSMEAALQGTWLNKPSITVATTDTEISDVSATTLTVASPLGSAFVAGMLVYTSGFTTPANNGILSRVSSSSTTSVVFPGSTFSVEGAVIPVGAAARVVGFQGASGDLVATVTGGNGITSTALDFTTLGLSVGEWLLVGGDTAGSQFATAGCNSWVQLSAITATRLSFNAAPVGWAADAGTSKTIQIFCGDRVQNGSTTRGFTIERQQLDIAAPSYEYFKGCEVNTWSLSLKPGAVVSGSIGMMGRVSPAAATSRVSGATDTAAPTNSIYNATSNIARMMEGGLVVGTGSTIISELSYEISNNMQPAKGVGIFGAAEIGDFEFGLSGTFNAYYTDITVSAKVVNDTLTSIMFRPQRPDGTRYSYVFDVPAARLTGKSTVDAKNQFRMFSGKYDAQMHATMGYTASIGRYWYMPAAAA